MPAMSIPLGNRYRQPIPMPLPLEESGLRMPEHDVDPDSIPERPSQPLKPRTLH